MMGVTHIFAGTMSAVLLTGPESPGGCLAALIGGSLGGVICDVDLGKAHRPADSARAVQLTAAIVAGCLLLDGLLGAGLIRSIGRIDAGRLMAGLAGVMLLCLWGRAQPHRGGTHSVLAVLLLAGCAELVCPKLTMPFFIGMVSHLALDLLNRRPLRLLYPLRGGWCLGLSRADGRLDRLLRMTGLLGTVLGIGISIGGFR